jgi:hypothetical protein
MHDWAIVIGTGSFFSKLYSIPEKYQYSYWRLLPHSRQKRWIAYQRYQIPTEVIINTIVAVSRCILLKYHSGFEDIEKSGKSLRNFLLRRRHILMSQSSCAAVCRCVIRQLTWFQYDSLYVRVLDRWEGWDGRAVMITATKAVWIITCLVQSSIIKPHRRTIVD